MNGWRNFKLKRNIPFVKVTSEELSSFLKEQGLNISREPVIGQKTFDDLLAEKNQRKVRISVGHRNSDRVIEGTDDVYQVWAVLLRYGVIKINIFTEDSSRHLRSVKLDNENTFEELLASGENPRDKARRILKDSLGMDTIDVYDEEKFVCSDVRIIGADKIQSKEYPGMYLYKCKVYDFDMSLSDPWFGIISSRFDFRWEAKNEWKKRIGLDQEILSEG